MNDDHPSETVERWLANRENSQLLTQVSIIIPAYNEYLRLPLTLIEILDFIEKNGKELNLLPCEIIIVDDGSRDQTCEIVEKFQRVSPNIRLIKLANNSGKGYAIKSGVINALGEIVIFVDADGATPFGEFTKLLSAIRSGQVDIAFGSRAISSQDTTVKTNLHRRLLGRVFNTIVNIIALPNVHDSQCGFKMFTKQAARELFSQQKLSGFSFDVELLYLARKLNFRTSEIAINWRNIPGSKVNLYIDSFKMFYDLLRIPFLHRKNLPREHLFIFNFFVHF
jgi:dolichyl-phosphate beta-glucosyltransferase